MLRLSLIDGLVCIAYLGIVVWLAIRSARGQQDNEDYFIGSRKMSWVLVGISMFATSFSSISFLGLPQRGAYQDFSFYLTILCIPFVITPILWWIFVPVFVKLRVNSGYEYLGLRFGSGVRRFGSALYCVYALGWMGAMLYAIALTLQIVMGLSDSQYYWVLIGVGTFATLYTVVGGLKAVIWTDVLQAIVLGGAIVLLLILTVGRIDGGWLKFWEIASAHEKFRMINLNSDWLAKENFTKPNSVFTAVAFGIFMYLPGYAVAQNMIQRYVCAGKLSSGRGVALLSAIINAALGLLFLLMGTALFAFYSQAGGAGLPVAGAELKSEDQIMPYFVATQLSGVGLLGLILAGLFAAAMSTIDSGINGVTSVIVYDWLAGKELPIQTSRLITGALGILVIAAAVMAPVFGDTIIGIINTLAGTSLGMLLAVFLLGLFVPWANTRGTWIGFAVGLLSLAAVWLLTDIPKWWFGAFTMIPVFVVGLIASSFFPAPSQATLDTTLLKRILKSGD
jgi:solute:Na+ symporter, SSS family